MRTSDQAGKKRHWNGWSLAGTGLALLGLGWILRRLDLAEVEASVEHADWLFLALVPLAIVTEQLVRAWKWRQILHPLRTVGTMRLFGAIMTGYLASFLVPFGASPLARAWLVARLEQLSMSAALASVAIDRLIDGIVFAGLVLLVVAFAAFPDARGEIRFGLAAAALASLGAIVAALALLWHHKRAAAQSWVLRAAGRLPLRFAARARSLALTFAEGILWPAERWRGAAILAASVLIKALAASDFLWAALAFHVRLAPFAYLVLLAILGFIVVLENVARIPGGFVLGSVFALGLYGVSEARALAMVTVVMVSSLLAIGLVGAFTLWRHGLALGDLKAQRVSSDRPA